ncbi:unnamed protein product [Penicillium olsonii]|uniref:Uncharacterized protein n=1 Tax=Penicillium olsonii TaxID=99116 RepID=A0A9W4N0B4_PENOL|nr:unnamed protein product [Penicillium olsonii]CAG8203872.1 unnamed protein product [Penicillium olsonii]
MFLYRLLYPEPPPVEIMEEVRKRTPVPLSFELIRQTEIFIEETLYPQAFSLLLDVLASGNVCSETGTVASTPVVIPQPQHLSIAATMLVHPFTTTRAKLDAEKEAPNIALRLLRLTNSLVGPTAAQFHTAFAFTHFETTRRGTRRANSPALNEPLTEEKKKAWEASYSGGRSVWNEAEDFWHAVGWAFNCSVLHPAQWKHWHLWLQFMCQVLEDDWADREQQYGEAQEKETQQRSDREASIIDHPEPATDKGRGGRPRKSDKVKQKDGLEIFRDSLLYQYVMSDNTYGRNRRIMRAIFADGQPKSAEFRSVFEDEIKAPRRKKVGSNLRKRAGVDLSKGEYGDYQNDSDDEYASLKESRASPTPGQNRLLRAPKRIRQTRNSKDTATDSESEASDIVADHENGIASIGGYNALALRQRLLGLLSKFSVTLPKDFLPIDDIYHMFAENIRDLPLPVFQHMVTPSNLQGLEPEAHSSLCEMIFFVMRESSAPTSEDDFLTAAKFETCFLPYMAASPTAANNAKISILLEAMMALLYNEKMLSATPGLVKAARTGIERRQDACRGDSNTMAAAYLRESSFRIQFMVDSILP